MARALFLLLTFRQERFIEEATRAALAQTGEPLDILISDDCSDDGTWDVIQKTAREYDGPHSLRTVRNEQNLGLISHLNARLAETDAQHVIVAAGDDVSLPDRARLTMDAFRNTGALLVHSDIDPIDEHGQPVSYPIRGLLARTESIDRAAKSLGLYIGATGAWDRHLFTNYAPLPEGVYEDLIFGFRAALEKRVAYINQPLVRYRTDVGISALPNSTMTVEHWRKDRTAAVARGIRTFRQRLTDNKASGIADNARVARTLQSKLKEYEARAKVIGLSKLDLFSNPRHLTPRIIRAWWSEQRHEARRG